MTLAIGTFVFSFFGITGFFALKEWELRRGRMVLPQLRRKLDELAFHIRDLLLALEADFEKLPSESLHVARLAVQRVALFLAGLLRMLSIQAHRLADMVSHKHSFRRRAPRSEFLKKVLEHKNDNSAPSDTLDTKF